MGEKADAFPDFLDPPVNETVLSVQFQPIPSFSIAHFGLYWPRVRSEFGRTQVAPALAQTTEDFSGFKGARLALQMVNEPEIRCWYLDQTGERLIQLQRDRFIHNWRQIDGSEKYPRYPAVRDAMRRYWMGFLEFLKDEKLEAPQVNQCDVTYVNHIDYGRGWKDYGELARVLAPWSGRNSGRFLPSPERVGIDAHYLMPENMGRLHVQALPVVRGRDSKEVLQVTLTARGAPKSQSTDDVFAWLDVGREWVVKGFADFTAEDVHRLWGRQI